MIKLLGKILLGLIFFLPTFTSAATSVPWQITNPSDTFIFPALVNGANKGLYITGNVGIGIQAPTALFTVSRQSAIQASVSGSTGQFVGLDANPLRITFDTHNNANTSGTAFMFRRSRGTAATPTAVQTDDVIGSLNFRGYGITGYAAGSTALMTAKAEGVFTDTSMATALTFDTTPTTTVTALERLRISGNGNIGIGTTTPGTILSLGNTGANTINVNTTATSTFGHGINIGDGCFAVANTCISSGTNYFNLTGNNLQNNVGNALGINTSPDFASLEVQGTTSDVTANGLQIWNSSGRNILRARNDGIVAVGSSTPYSTLSIGNLVGDTRLSMFNISSSTAAATTSLFNVSNIGAVNAAGSISSAVNIAATGQVSGASASFLSGGFTVASSVVTYSGGNSTVTSFNVQSNSLTSGTGFSSNSSNNTFTGTILSGSYSGTGSGRVANFSSSNASASGNVLNVTNAGTGNLAIFNGTGNVGIGTTSPFALLSVATPAGASGSLGTLFAIASSTAGTATSTLFSISNTGKMSRKIGTNVGTSTLSSGSVTVSTGEITANSIVRLTLQSCSSCGTPYLNGRTPGTSFTISSTNVLDSSIVLWEIIEPNF